jgi:single-strand DNA-binding protein
MRLNKVQLIGHVGADPIVRYLDNSKCVASFNVATDEGYMDKTTLQWVKRAEWHRITCWDQQAKFVEANVKKGSEVYVEGKLTTEKYTDKDNIEKFVTKINASSVQANKPAVAQNGGPYATNGQPPQQQAQRNPVGPNTPAPGQASQDFTAFPEGDDLPF